jgi:hypothetical protein
MVPVVGQQFEPSCQLWGVSVLWWGRIGKLLGTAGFVALIFEILGPERVKLWGKSLRKGIVRGQLQKSRETAERIADILHTDVWHLVPGAPPLMRPPSDSKFVSPFMAAFFALFFTLGLIGTGAFWVALKWWTTGGLWDASLWQVPLFLVVMLM